MTDPVTIVDLQVENFKIIRAARIQPQKGAAMVPITGKNGMGKSSVLDAIKTAMGGKEHMPSVPVRKGEDDGAIRLELSNGLVVLRTFDTEGGGKIIVQSGDGARYPSPQAVLDKLYSSVSFDPIGFTRLQPKDQLTRLRSLVTLEVDVDKLTAENKADYDLRRDKNRELKVAQAALDQMPEHFGLPDEPEDEAALEERINGAVEHNSAIERRKVNREDFARRLQHNRDDLADLIEQRAALDIKIDVYGTAIADQEKQLASAEPLPEPIDVTEAQSELRAARDINQRLQQHKVRNAQALMTIAIEKAVETIETRMAERTAAITKAFENATMPVKGLTFGEGEVLFDGIPLEQASTAQQLRISTAIGMAMAPDLRIMLVRDASLLDEEGFALLTEMAEAGGFQFWVESVARDEAVGIIMEDGEVKDAPTPEPIDKGRRRPRKEKDAAAQEAHAEATDKVLEITHDATTGEVQSERLVDAPETPVQDERPEPSPEPEIAPSADPAPIEQDDEDNSSDVIYDADADLFD